MLLIDGDTQEEVCWGRRQDEGKYEETRAGAAVVPEETIARDRVEPDESGAGGKHSMTLVEVPRQSLISGPGSARAQVDVVKLQYNDIAAGYPCSRASNNSGVSLPLLCFFF